MKTDLVTDATGQLLFFWCPACATHHAPRVSGTSGPVWTWNGDRDRPTVQPSIRVEGVQWVSDADLARIRAGEAFDPAPLRCHLFLSDGRIQYLGDCTHALAGQIVELEEIP